MDANPPYNIDSAELKKHRFAARDGLHTLDRYYRQAYGAAVEKAVLAKQRSECARHVEVMPAPRCASGTWHTTGEAIHKALRAKQAAKLAACPSSIRKARLPMEWGRMYREAMPEGFVPSWEKETT